MNTRFHAIVGFLILLSGFLIPMTLPAQEMVIDSANPSEAEQGTVNLEVAINGDGFDKSVKEVKFLVNCEQPCEDDPGGVVVNSYRVNNSKKITANISVGAEAKLSSYDIAVRTRGRGGKGTTYRGQNLFTVKLRPNQQLLSCGEVIENHKGTCTCQFVWNGDDSFLPALIDDCVTSETLNIKLRFTGAHTDSASDGDQLTITAVPCGSAPGQDCTSVPLDGFSGSAVIANSIHRASIRFLDIRFHENVARGCGVNDVQSAVSFVLDDDTPNPRVSLPSPDNPDPLYRNSLLYVNNIGIYSEDKPLCNGIEIVRMPIYTSKWTTDPTAAEFPARDWKVFATENHISPDSYLQAGIVMLGIMPSENINPPSVFGNTIGAGDCGDSNPIGILFGEHPPDSENQVDGVIENNMIAMAPGCEDTAISVVGDSGGVQTTVKVAKNVTTGAHLGIDVDGNVLEVNLSGNNLTGDDYPTGISSTAQCTRTKGKPNQISGYEVKISDAGCP